jgi:hypothetical protein
MVKCPHHKTCKKYSDTSLTCNVNGGEYYENGGDAGCKREMDKRVRKISWWVFIFLFAFMFIGVVSAVECNATSVENGGIINSSSLVGGCTLIKAGTYTMSGENMNINTTDNILNFAGSNIILNCNNSHLSGNVTNGKYYTNKFTGFFASGRSNLTLTNCYLSNLERGIYLRHATNITLINITTNENRVAIFYENLTDSSIYNSSDSVSWLYGVYIYVSNRTTIDNLKIVNQNTSTNGAFFNIFTDKLLI